MQADVFFQNDQHYLLKYQYRSEVDFCSTKPRRADNDWGNLSGDAGWGAWGAEGPCARLDATLGHQGFTNLGTLDSVREGKFERSPDGLKILESCWARENDECGSAQSGDDLSRRGLSVLRMLRMRVVQKETRYFRALHATTSQRSSFN